jgi:hypothetical protein
MNTNDPREGNERLDAATAGRLSRLRTMLVDTSHLEAMIVAKIPRHADHRRMSFAWLGRARAIAAAVAILLLVGTILQSISGGPVLASPAQMAQVHDDLVSGRAMAVQVDSIEAANKALASQWPKSPGLPLVPREHVMACCMKSVHDKKVACVLLKSEGVPVTLTVANASDMRLPDSPVVLRGGITYHVQATGLLNMVMAERHGRWVCLIGEVAADRLMDIAARLQF